MEPTDNMEKGVRFGCGFTFGLVFGGAGLGFGLANSQLVVIVFVAAVVSGLAAMRYGDRFWQWMKNWF